MKQPGSQAQGNPPSVRLALPSPQPGPSSFSSSLFHASPCGSPCFSHGRELHFAAPRSSLSVCAAALLPGISRGEGPLREKELCRKGGKRERVWLKNRRKIWLAAPGDLNFQPLSFVIGRPVLKVGLAIPKGGLFILPFPLDEVPATNHKPQTNDKKPMEFRPELDLLHCIGGTWTTPFTTAVMRQRYTMMPSPTLNPTGMLIPFLRWHLAGSGSDGKEEQIRCCRRHLPKFLTFSLQLASKTSIVTVFPPGPVRNHTTLPHPHCAPYAPTLRGHRAPGRTLSQPWFGSAFRLPRLLHLTVLVLWFPIVSSPDWGPRPNECCLRPWVFRGRSRVLFHCAGSLCLSLSISLRLWHSRSLLPQTDKTRNLLTKLSDGLVKSSRDMSTVRNVVSCSSVGVPSAKFLLGVISNVSIASGLAKETTTLPPLKPPHSAQNNPLPARGSRTRRLQSHCRSGLVHSSGSGPGRRTGGLTAAQDRGLQLWESAMR